MRTKTHEKKYSEMIYDSTEKPMYLSNDVEMSYKNNDGEKETSISDVEQYLESNKANMGYYLWKLRNLGSKFLYSKAFFPQQEKSIYLVDEYDAKFSLLFAEFSLGLTVKSRQTFLNLLSQIKPYMLPSQPSESHQLKIPVEMSQF